MRKEKRAGKPKSHSTSGGKLGAYRAQKITQRSPPAERLIQLRAGKVKDLNLHPPDFKFSLKPLMPECLMVQDAITWLIFIPFF